MNNEKDMAKILNWARFDPYMRPNDLGEGPMLIIIPKVIRIDYSLLEFSRRFSLILIRLELIIIFFDKFYLE